LSDYVQNKSKGNVGGLKGQGEMGPTNIIRYCQSIRALIPGRVAEVYFAAEPVMMEAVP